MDHSRHQNCKNNYTEKNNLKNIQKKTNRILKAKISLFKLENVFKELREIELNDREMKIRREIKELL